MGPFTRVKRAIPQQPELRMEGATARGDYLGDHLLQQGAETRLRPGLGLDPAGLAKDRQPIGSALEPFEQGERAPQKFVLALGGEQREGLA